MKQKTQNSLLEGSTATSYLPSTSSRPLKTKVNTQGKKKNVDGGSLWHAKSKRDALPGQLIMY